MKKSKIYTKSGDEGKTALVSGNRTFKSDLRIDLYGELDELNSRLGYACSLLTDKFVHERTFIHMLQSSLFDLGSNMACEFENREKYNLPQISQNIVDKIEKEIDRMDAELDELKNFILPGGSLASAAVHLARTGARNVERKLVHYENVTQEVLPQFSMVFLNRISDYFFVLARYINKLEGVKEVVWKPER